MFDGNMGLGRNIKNSCYQFLRLYAVSERSAIAHKYSYAFARVKSMVHPVSTIPYVWRVTHDYINEGLKEGQKIFGEILLSILGLQAIKGYNIVNIYKMILSPPFVGVCVSISRAALNPFTITQLASL